jgi:hypothetical protein
MKTTKLALFLCILFLPFAGKGQDVYKTPSGKKYHLSSCRMVENVSKKLVDGAAASRYHLTPCKICKPPQPSRLQASYSTANKAVGTSQSVQCKGRTQKGTRCKHETTLANAYCYQHTAQNSSARTAPVRSTTTVSSACGARNKSGGYCKRKVKGGGRCWQHG